MALEQDDDNQWDDAIQNEYNSLIKNNTWTLTKLPLRRHIIGCKWVFCIKYKVDGQVDKYKACLVAKNYSQVLGMDYMETFSSIVKLSSTRIIRPLWLNIIMRSII